MVKKKKKKKEIGADACIDIKILSESERKEREGMGEIERQTAVTNRAERETSKPRLSYSM